MSFLVRAVQRDRSNTSNVTKSSSAVQQLVSLFSAFPPLDQLSVHLLCHLVVSFLFLFGFPAVLDGLNPPVPLLLLFLFHFQFSCLGHLLDLVLLLAFGVRDLTGIWSKSLFRGMPIFPCGEPLAQEVACSSRGYCTVHSHSPRFLR